MGCGASTETKDSRSNLNLNKDFDVSLSVACSDDRNLQAPKADQCSPSQNGLSKQESVETQPLFHSREQGVSVSFLHEFCETLSSKDLKTHEIVSTIVVPRTLDRKCRFIDTLPSDSIGAPHFFISHGWGEIFAGQVAKISGFLKSRGLCLEDTFVWLDIFSVNQHPGEEQQADLSHLQDMVSVTQKTLLLLDDNGSALTRIWILYEIWKTCTLKSPAELVVIVSQIDSYSLEIIWETLDVLKAQATMEADRLQILNSIEQTVGAKELGTQIQKALVQSVWKEVENWPEDQTNSLEFTAIFQKLGVMLICNGEQQLGIQCLEQCLTIQKENHDGLWNDSTLQCLDQLCRLSADGHAAVDYAQQLLDITISCKGKGTVDHAKALITLGDSFMRIFKFAKTIEHCEEAIKIFEALKTGEFHIAHAHAIVGKAYSELGRPDDSKAFISKAAKFFESNLNESSYATLGDLLIDSDPDKSREMYQKELEVTMRAFHPNHNYIATSYCKIANTFIFSGRSSEALEYYSKAEAIWKANEYQNHNSWANLYLKMAECFDHVGNFEQAVKYFNMGLEERRSYVGSDDFSGVFYRGLGDCYMKLSHFSEAQKAYRTALQILLEEETMREKEMKPAYEGLVESIASSGHTVEEAAQLSKQFFLNARKKAKAKKSQKGAH